MKTSEILHKAAQIADGLELNKDGYFFRFSDSGFICAACTLGFVQLACSPKPLPLIKPADVVQQVRSLYLLDGYDEARIYVKRALGDMYPFNVISVWSDSEDVTKEMVQSLLMFAAELAEKDGN